MSPRTLLQVNRPTAFEVSVEVAVVVSDEVCVDVTEVVADDDRVDVRVDDADEL